MPGPMEGIRAVELVFLVAGPSVGGVLADGGASVDRSALRVRLGATRRLGAPLPR